jgi:hypothetical protein
MGGHGGWSLDQKIKAILKVLQGQLKPRLGAIFEDLFGEEGVRRWKGVRGEYADHADEWFAAQEEESTKVVTMNAMQAVKQRHLAAATAGLLQEEQAGGAAVQVHSAAQ